MSINLVFTYVVLFITFVTLGFMILRNSKVNTQVRIVLHVLFVSIAIWFFCNCMVQLSQTDRAVWFWHEIKFIGVFAIPAANFSFILHYIKLHDKLPTWVKRAILIIPIITILIALTNQWTHLFRTEYTVFRNSGALIYVITKNGIGYYITSFYHYALVILGTLLLVRHAYRLPKYYRLQPILLILAIAIPIGLNISFNVNFLGEHYDFTSLGFAFTGILYYVTTTKFEVPDVIPIAREAIVNSMEDAIVVCDNSGTIIDFNPKVQEGAELYGADLMGSNFIEQFEKYLVNSNAKKVSQDQRYIFTIGKDEESKYFEYLTTRIMKKHQPLGFLHTFRDITDNYKMVKRLETMATRDVLTGLYSRNYFNGFYETKTNRVGIIYGGLNSFKLINESYGVEVGDNILQKVAKVLEDKAPANAIVSRYEGDEFAIVLEDHFVDGMSDLIDQITVGVGAIEIQNITVSICLSCEEFSDSPLNISQMISSVQKNMDRKKLLETRSSKSAIIESLRLTLEQSDYETKQHTDRTTKLAVMIGERIGLPQSELSDLAMLAALHDIGKVSIPDSILLKPGKLTKEEFDVMKSHTQKGYQIAISSPDLVSVADGILHHHEKYDGSGYPDGLKGEEISIQSRIITIVDSFDVMVNDRPYKVAMSIDEAVEELVRCKGNHFDPNLVDILLDIIEKNDV